MTWFAVGAAVVAGVSAISQADSQRKALHYQQDVARVNAQAAREQAVTNEDGHRRMAAIELGRQAASNAENGGNTGTNLDMFQQSAANAEMDALNIRYKGKLGVMSYDNQATLDGMAATNANNAGYLNAASSALSAYGSYTRGTTRNGGGLG